MTCLCRRITTYIHYFFCFHFQDTFHDIGVHSCTRWIGNDHIRSPMLAYEICRQHILHIARIELSITNSIDLRIDFCVFNCRWQSEEHTSELQSRENLVCRLLLENKNSHLWTE